MKKIFTRSLGLGLLAMICPTIHAQLPGNALDYMLQKPAVAKQYKNKHFGDHFFMELGAGTNLMGRNDLKPGTFGEAHLGDWVTPEHGWRLGVSNGTLRNKYLKTKFAGLSLDYLMNITAVANRTYRLPQKFEVYGLAGADLLYSQHKGETQSGWGFHLGLRGQYAIGSYTYLYIEPKAGLIGDKVAQAETWQNFQPTASLTLGAGYRLGGGQRLPAANHEENRRHCFSDGLFISLQGGAAFTIKDLFYGDANHTGGRLSLGIGKQFDPYHALRLSAQTTVMDRDPGERLKSAGLQMDYLLNLHNLMGGPDETRRWWINLLAGTSINLGTAEGGKHTSWGLGGGLQGVARLNNQFQLLVEPRLDLYNNNYLCRTYADGNWTSVPTVLFGLNYTYNSTHLYGHISECRDETPAWRSHTFVEAGAGVNTAITRGSISLLPNNLRPQAYMAVGKWFTPLHGARAWGMLAETEYRSNHKYRHGEVGMDYLFNVSNAISGYNPYRTFGLEAGIGVNVSLREERHTPFLGMNASIKGLWNVNPLLTFYVEPRLNGYGKRYLPTNLSNNKIDWIASANAGMQINFRGYDRKTLYTQMAEDGGPRSSISLAGGMGVQANRMSSSEYRGPILRMSYTQWFSPLSAWRATMQGFVNKTNGSKYAAGTLGLDYLTDLTAHTYGYDPQRLLSISALTGVEMGTDYTRGHSRFVSDIHAGANFALHLGGNLGLYAEPQLAYRMSKRLKGERLDHFMPRMLFGLDYSISHKGKPNEIEPAEKRRFVSAALGTGLFSPTATYMSPKGRRLTFVSDLSYGQWLTGIHGVEGAISTTHVQRYGKGSENITSLRANYMMNVRAAMTGEQTDDKLFQITGLAGASLHVSSYSGRKAQVAPGLQLALQTGWRITPQVELYLQPEASLLSNRIQPNGSARPFEGLASLTLGTKYCF